MSDTFISEGADARSTTLTNVVSTLSFMSTSEHACLVGAKTAALVDAYVDPFAGDRNHAVSKLQELLSAFDRFEIDSRGADEVREQIALALIELQGRAG